MMNLLIENMRVSAVIEAKIVDKIVKNCDIFQT